MALRQSLAAVLLCLGCAAEECGESGQVDAATHLILDAATAADATVEAGPGPRGVDAGKDIPACSFEGGGGRGNACGGVVPDVRTLQGTGFDAYEGETVVSAFGVAKIVGGSFTLYLDFVANCEPLPIAYRIDLERNGRCDDGDLVYESPGSPNFFQPVTGAEPGTEVTCAKFADGHDVQLQVHGEDFPDCGHMEAGLYDASGTSLGSRVVIYPSDVGIGYGFAGLVKPGETYRLRYSWNNEVFPNGICARASSRGWERELVAQASTNLVELSNDPRGGSQEHVCGPMETCTACEGTEYCLTPSFQCLVCAGGSHITRDTAVCAPCPDGYAAIQDLCFPNVCTPGATRACTCTDGVQGAETCSELGIGFGPCSCADGGAAP